jgi:hypothetical protein
MGPFTAALQAAGFGTYGTTLFEGPDADIPSSTTTSPAIISVRETGGERDSRNHTPDGKVAHPSFQITVRHARYPTASALIHAMHDWCGNQHNVVLGGKFWLWIEPEQRPFDRGKDANQRVLLTFNVSTAVRD